MAFKMRADGKSYREIIKATDGRLYTAINSWPSFFANRSYLGIGKCGDEEFPDHHEPLIDMATFEAVQAYHRLHPRAGLSHPRRIAFPSLLSGLAYCARCGASMIYHKSSHKHWPFYICSKRDRTRYMRECDGQRVNARKVDTLVFDTVLKQILTPSYFEDLLEETRQALADTGAIDREIEQKNESLRLATQAMNNLLQLVETFGPGAAMDKYKMREAEITRVKYEIQELKARRQALDVEVTPEALTLALEAWREEITQERASGNVAALRELLSRFVSKIELDYGKVKIWYTFPMTDLIPSNDPALRGGTK
jgi:hypothetical protein